MTKTNKDSKLGAILNKAIIVLLTVFTLYLIYLNFSYSIKNKVLIFAVFVIPVVAIIFFVSYKFNISPLAFTITIFILSFLAKSILIFMTDTQPVSDFNTFYQCAIHLLNGDKAFGHTYYFKTWAYQTGPIIYYAAIMKLFGTALLPLKLVNCFFMAVSNALIYLIAKKISNDYAARFIAFLYLLYPATYFMATVLTNQHFAACMFLLAIYILLINGLNFWVKGILAGVVMSLGNAVRPLGIVIIGGLIIWGIVEVIRRKNVSKTVIIAIVLVSYFLMNLGMSAMVKYSDINPEGLKNNYPLWKFVIGFNNSSQGRFSYEDQDKIFYIQDFDQRNAVSKQVIRERLAIGPRKLVDLLDSKQRIMWAEYDTIRWGFYQKINGKLVAPENIKNYEPIILNIEKVYYIIIFLLMILGLFRVFRSRRVQSPITLLSLILMCYFGAHVLIEIQVRYRYFALMLVFILAAKGSELLLSGFRGYREKYPLKEI